MALPHVTGQLGAGGRSGAGPTANLSLRVRSALALAVYLALTASFALPFVTVSCDETKTEELTGFELVTKKDPALVGPQPADEVEEVGSLVQKLQGRAQVAFLLTIMSIALAATVAAFGRAFDSRLLLAAATAVPLGLLALVFGNVFGADVHHLRGLWVALALGAAGQLLSFNVAEAAWRAQALEGHSARYHRLVKVSLVSAGVVLLAMPFGGGAGFAGIAAVVGVISGFIALLTEPGKLALIAAEFNAVVLTITAAVLT